MAAQSPAGIAFNEILPWIGALLVLAILGGALVLYLRHRLLGPEEDTGQSLMDELRSMRERGEMSEEEYEQARLVMVARATGRDYEQLKAESIRKAGGMVAEPGYDLTGRPLPGSTQTSSGNMPPEEGPGPPETQE